MGENKYNSIGFCREDYEKYDDDTHSTYVDYYTMYDDIANIVRILLKNEYQIKIWDDGFTVSVEFNYSDPDMGAPMLEWIEKDGYNERYDN